MEREQEREEFQHDLDQLQTIVKEKEKKGSQEHRLQREVKVMMSVRFGCRVNQDIYSCCDFSFYLYIFVRSVFYDTWMISTFSLKFLVYNLFFAYNYLIKVVYHFFYNLM